MVVFKHSGCKGSRLLVHFWVSKSTTIQSKFVTRKKHVFGETTIVLVRIIPVDLRDTFLQYSFLKIIEI